MAITKGIIFILGYLLILISVFPLVRNDNWVFRIFEYPRVQKLFINLVLVCAFLPLSDLSQTHDVIFLSALLLNIIYLVYQIWPYTRVGRKQMKKAGHQDDDSSLTLYICNVYQDNRDIETCLASIQRCDPDIILLVETDQKWKKGLDVLRSNYPYSISKILDNTYGMILYSRFELLDARVRYLVQDDIPSIHCKVLLPNGEMIMFHGLHPQPPVPHESARSTERDAEILLVAKEAKRCPLPVIVAGDLNDVAWSYTTELFMKVSRMLDPRRGRGFFNTFHAHYWFLRWPLDHVFCSNHFNLLSLSRLPSIGSDHFPILIRVQLAHEAQHANEEMMQATADEEQAASEKIQKAQTKSW
jgi:endonuclease/exonuclease/phosphatase (EEP) superfamily protein YafD